MEFATGTFRFPASPRDKNRHRIDAGPASMTPARHQPIVGLTHGSRARISGMHGSTSHGVMLSSHILSPPPRYINTPVTRITFFPGHFFRPCSIQLLHYGFSRRHRSTMDSPSTGILLKADPPMSWWCGIRAGAMPGHRLICWTSIVASVFLSELPHNKNKTLCNT